MRQLIHSQLDPKPDFECACGFAIFDTTNKQQEVENLKAEYERETGFRPYR